MNRREFVATGALGATAVALGCRPHEAEAAAPPETTKIRLIQIAGVWPIEDTTTSTRSRR